jgi:hypothetical protein
MPLNRDLLLGSWRMTSWVTTDVATGEQRDALGENVRGFALYTPERVMFLILKSNRKPPQRSPPSDEEKIALYDTMFAYSGSYTVESDRVIHHVDMSWNEAWSGTEQVRYGALHDHTLTYRTAAAKNPFDGLEVTHEAIFEREKRPLN